METGDDPRRCETWQEHEFGGTRYLEAGRHPSMGRYQKYVVRCERCGLETTETVWRDLSRILWPMTDDARLENQ